MNSQTIRISFLPLRTTKPGIYSLVPNEQRGSTKKGLAKFPKFNKRGVKINGGGSDYFAEELLGFDIILK